MKNLRYGTECSDCPCLNTDYETESTCNLKYDTNLYWTPDEKLIYASDDCKLYVVEYQSETDGVIAFKPEQVLCGEK